MEKKKAMDGYTQFAGMLAPLLGEQMRTSGMLSGELTLLPLEARTATEPASDSDQEATDGSAPAPEENVAVTLHFEGALTGECCVVVAASTAQVLASGSGELGSVLRSALGSVIEPFAAALFAHYGSVHIHVQDNAEIPEGSVVMVRLSGATADGAPVLLTLHADGELQRGLPRLARVAAAAEASGITHGNLGLVMDVELNVTLRFGQRQLSLRDVMDLASGSVVELDREVDEPVELILDGRVIARGEAVIVDGNYGVRVTEVLQPMVM